MYDAGKTETQSTLRYTVRTMESLKKENIGILAVGLLDVIRKNIFQGMSSGFT